MDKNLNIVCHDIPWPVSHGGFFDLFYKLKEFHKAGIKIHLHCFYSKRKFAEELNKYCVSVNYYKRRKIPFSFSVPFIVNSRRNSLLLQNLKKNDFPVLFEGIHCTYELFKNNLTERKVIVRLHNVEFMYYYGLSKCESNILKRFYFKIESYILKKYEKQIANKALFITVSEKDKSIYQNEFHAREIEFIPVYIPYNKVLSNAGKGDFCLYHGNLEINENEKAAIWLIENVYNSIDQRLIIAGRNPSTRLQKEVLKHDNVILKMNPSDNEIETLLAEAQINILPSFNYTGVKLKIINSLFTGRFCLVNSRAIDNSGLSELCVVAQTPQEMQMEIEKLFSQTFTQKMIEERENKLLKIFDNEDNTQKFISLIFQKHQ